MVIDNDLNTDLLVHTVGLLLSCLLNTRAQAYSLSDEFFFIGRFSIVVDSESILIVASCTESRGIVRTIW